MEADIKTAEDIWGKEVGFLKGQTVHRTASAFADNVVSMPSSLKQRCACANIHLDALSVGKRSFLMSVGEPSHCRDAAPLKSKDSKTFMKQWMPLFANTMMMDVKLPRFAATMHFTN